MRVVFLGPPGAGKGTQASLLAKAKSIPALSTGDILRAAIEGRTSIGTIAKGYVDSGGLVPDEVVVGVVKERLAYPDASAGFILDGFPRTLAQAASLDDILADAGMRIDLTVELTVDDSQLLSRIQRRAEIDAASGRKVRSDDNRESFEIRMNAYRQATKPLSEYYENQGKLVRINGLASVEDIAADIGAAVAACSWR
ncbi:adenylate kinase [Rhizobium altiplani]|uniref:Adenylate kinase n=1 Tax=Rhizobium altiplani TaxID=1864509 RepID=A0A109JSA9_9HYPH|nr:adenylate kinase [Rhizobium altiplani]KWV54166.1 adenylate kinase [Rhizobium altiplani]